jgi:hypothetical protein
MQPLKVICFYWQGDRWQQEGYEAPEGHVNMQQKTMRRWGQMDNKLPAQYINNLYEGVCKHASRPFEFICFTNEDFDLLPGVEIRKFPLVTEHGVLPRIYMFSKEAGLFGSQVLCLDLDVVVVGDLSPLMEYEGDFCTRAKFKPGETHKIDGDIMSFNACQDTENMFWNPFILDVDAAVELTGGRERYWVRHVTENTADVWQNVAPGAVVSYKWHVKRTGIPQGASIVSCHGHPRPHQLKDGSNLKQHWNCEI